ncbi:MAG: ABC transporter substrate-binding protein, partial [Burkholderiales bacterium]
MKIKRIFSLLVIAGLVAGVITGCGEQQSSGGTDPGVTDTEIKIGSTNPYSGPASAYGTIGRATTAYFKMVNDEGGVNGRKINFISLDDGYSPPRTVEQIRKLVEED